MQSQILAYLSPAITVTFTIVFVSLWRRDRDQIHILAYSGWFAAVALATALQAFLLSDFGPYEVLLLHLVLASGAISLLWGITRRYELAIPLKGLVFVALVYAVLCWISGYYGNQKAYLIAQNGNIALFFALGAFSVWSSPRRTPTRRILIAALSIAALYGMIRPVVLVLGKTTMSAAEYQASSIMTVNIVVNAVIALFLALALLSTMFEDELKAEREACQSDPLSGLYLRGAFEDRAKQLIKIAHDQEIALSLIITDIDHFKTINDTYGHAVGDTAIARFGDIIRSNIRSKDMAGRVGGEEFCILAWNCPLGPASNLAERIRVAVERKQRQGDEERADYTASFGVAQLRRDEGYQLLFERADEYLYKAKRTGRNRVHTQDGPVHLPHAQIVEIAALKDRRQAS